MTRAEHLQWCKDRALALCDAGEPDEAVNSMLSDMRKHDETRDHPAIMIMFQMKLMGLMSDVNEVRKFINGFH